MAQQIEVQIKHLSSKNFSVQIGSDASVGDLRALCEKQSDITSSEIKLIFKGKILKDDEEKIADLKIENGSAVHMVHNKPQQQTEQVQQQGPNQAQQVNTTPSYQQPQQQADLSGFGLPSGMDLGSIGGMDQNQLGQMMQNPMMRQMAQNLLSNPEQLRAMIQGNPMLSSMVQSNPMFSQMMNNPDQLRQMSEMMFSGSQPTPQVQGQTQQIPQNFNLPNFSAPQQNQQPQGNPEEIYKEQLDRLQEMGFTNRQLNIQILQQTYGNVDAAVDKLLNLFQQKIK